MVLPKLTKQEAGVFIEKLCPECGRIDHAPSCNVALVQAADEATCCQDNCGEPHDNMTVVWVDGKLLKMCLPHRLWCIEILNTLGVKPVVLIG